MNRNIKHTPDLDTIRELVAKWYDATTTPEEDACLSGFFAQADADSLPADLRDEKLVFDSMTDIGRPNPDTALLDEIERAVKAESVATTTQVRHTPRIRLWAWASVAAAAAVIVALVLTVVRMDSDLSAPAQLSSQAVAQTREVTADQLRTDTDSVAIPTDTLACHVAEPAPVVNAQPRTRHIAMARPAAPKSDDGYQIVDDPEEAARILALVEQQLSSARTCSKSAMGRVEANLRKVDTTVATTLSGVL